MSWPCGRRPGTMWQRHRQGREAQSVRVQRSMDGSMRSVRSPSRCSVGSGSEPGKEDDSENGSSVKAGKGKERNYDGPAVTESPRLGMASN